jgi:LysR family carnitine catabolism transcriptional activator
VRELMEFTFRQLTAFAAVAQTRNFTVAARRLDVAQSSLSRAISELEKVVGMQLMLRDTRSIELTAAGRETLEVAEQLLDLRDSGVRRLQEFAAGEMGSVSIATLPSIAATLLPVIVARFHHEHPEIALSMFDGLERQVTHSVLRRKADLAITAATVRSEKLRYSPFVRDRFMAVLPRGHSLCELEAVGWSQLRDEAFIAIRNDSSVRRFSDAGLTAAGGHRGEVIEVGSVAGLAGLVGAGLGVSALPAMVIPLMGASTVECRPLVEPVIHRDIDIVLRAGTRDKQVTEKLVETLDGLRTERHPLPEGVEWWGGQPRSTSRMQRTHNVMR